MFKTILVSYDGSDHAQNAFDAAAAIAKSFGAQLHVAHTPQVDTPPIVIGSFVAGLEVPPSAAQIAEAGAHLAEEIGRRAKDAGVEIAQTHLGRGDPANFTLSVAQQTNADLIVMGRRGLGALGALALGSVSQAVSHGAKCACMTVI